LRKHQDHNKGRNGNLSSEEHRNLEEPSPEDHQEQSTQDHEDSEDVIVCVEKVPESTQAEYWARLL
jgi:hypothetical protein